MTSCIWFCPSITQILCLSQYLSIQHGILHRTVWFLCCTTDYPIAEEQVLNYVFEIWLVFSALLVNFLLALTSLCANLYNNKIGTSHLVPSFPSSLSQWVFNLSLSLWLKDSRQNSLRGVKYTLHLMFTHAAFHRVNMRANCLQGDRYRAPGQG